MIDVMPKMVSVKEANENSLYFQFYVLLQGELSQGDRWLFVQQEKGYTRQVFAQHFCKSIGYS